MKKLIIAIMMIIGLTTASADRYFIRPFKQSSIWVLNHPSNDLTYEFTKDLTIEEWSKLYVKLGKPEFQVAKTDKGQICYFYVTYKEGLYGRVSYLKEETE